MKKVYKFYKNDCAPCYALGRLLNVIEIPADIEIVELNVNDERNKVLAKNYGASVVPYLVYEDGTAHLEGKVGRRELIEFLEL